MKKKYIIKNKTFHKLWEEADKCEKLEDFTLILSNSSKTYRELEKCGLDELQITNIITEIFHVNKMEIKDLCTTANILPHDISHNFCIPKRTCQNWYGNTRQCPSWVKLMIARHYHIINLGPYIYTEYEIEQIELKPKTYKVEVEEKKEITQIKKKKNKPVHKTKQKTAKNTIFDSKSITTNKNRHELESAVKASIYGDDEDAFLELLERSTLHTRNQKTEDSLLKKTDYLDDIIKHKNHP